MTALIIVIVWLSAVIVGTAIGNRKGQPFLACFLCIVLSWLGVLIVVLSAGKKKMPCPHCKEPMMRNATICPHCRLTPNLPETQSTPQA